VIILDYGLLLTSVPDSFLFGLDANTLRMALINLFNVGVLAAVLAFLLYRPVRLVLRKRTERIQGQLIQAEEEMTRATELRQEYQQKMEDIESQREEILVEARKNATETGRRLIAEAKKEAEAIRERAANNVEMEWERAETEMRTAIVDVSAAMAEKFVSLAINKETHDRLFDETMKDLEGMTWRD